jgi:hypothetical protein
MFTKIVVALNDLPESQRALRTAIELARACNAELTTDEGRAAASLR